MDLSIKYRKHVPYYGKIFYIANERFSGKYWDEVVTKLLVARGKEKFMKKLFHFNHNLINFNERFGKFKRCHLVLHS